MLCVEEWIFMDFLSKSEIHLKNHEDIITNVAYVLGFGFQLVCVYNHYQSLMYLGGIWVYQ